MSRTADTATPAWRARSATSRRSAGEKSSSPGPPAQDQLADRLRPVEQREAHGAGHRLPGLDRRLPVGQPDRGVGQPERLPDGRHDRRQDGVGGQRALQPLAQPGQGGVGLGALAVEQPADRPLQPVAQRGEQHRHDAGGHQRDQQVVLAAQRGAEVADDEHVDRRRRRR